MNFSAVLRILRIPTCRRVTNQYSSSLLGTVNHLCNRRLKATSSFVQDSLTNFSMHGTGTSVRMRNITNAVRSSYFGHFTYLNTPSTYLHHERTFSTSQCRQKKEEITVNFLNRDGETFTVKAKVGETLLDTVIDNDVDIDGFGACEGTLACSTCHLIFDEEIFETLPEKLDEEEDMLDLAYGLEDTSRLGCQICLTKEMDNMTVSVPEGINDARDV